MLHVGRRGAADQPRSGAIFSSVIDTSAVLVVRVAIFDGLSIISNIVRDV